ncbi:ASCH domain-containing protein [Thiomicrorhabdus indica]|uniref:ASCH domain-containing protein n=1 Tax=Thiomicrorhabdus indica TaxID=2267253 RepID=UPI002AA84D7D|nr:ASCH domain-containing protein [Thiomicrorhabdus indica]
MNEQQEQFLIKYLDTVNPQHKNFLPNVIVDFFCADEINANICADLILKGEKTATCSLKYWYESGQEPMPEVGNLQIVTDWNGKPTSIIRTLKVTECAFNEVTEEFAVLEGEGDKTLDWWRKVHWDFFSKECFELGIQATPNMILVLEQFELVYKAGCQ